MDLRELAAVGRAVAWLAAVRLALRVLPYPIVSGAVDRMPRRMRRANRLTVEECGRAVQRAGRVAAATCLPRALAAECMLRREGHPSTRSFGVRLDDRQILRAHAWVESGGVLVAGGEDAANYLPLTRSPKP